MDGQTDGPRARGGSHAAPSIITARFMKPQLARHGLGGAGFTSGEEMNTGKRQIYSTDFRSPNTGAICQQWLGDTLRPAAPPCAPNPPVGVPKGACPPPRHLQRGLGGGAELCAALGCAFAPCKAFETQGKKKKK